MRYLSLFSGIEAASVAWKPLGWTCAGVAEIEPFPCSLLADYYPDAPNLGSVTNVTEAQIAALGPFDVLVFGSPCQDLSVAGKRKGFDGERSSLFYVAMRIVRWAREHCGLRWAVWENVPGAFSSNGGADFAAVVEHMAGLDSVAVPPRGWGTEGCAVGEEGMVEWSTLDAQWFGVAQRRRRVFAVADFGSWRDRPPVLLESESLRGDTAPRRSTRQEFAAAAEDCAGGEGGRGPVLALPDHEVVSSLDASFQRLQGASGQDMRHGHSHLVPIIFGFNARQDPDSWHDRAGPLDTFYNTQAVAFAMAFDQTQITSPQNCSRVEPGLPSPTLCTHGKPPTLVAAFAVHDVAPTLGANGKSAYGMNGQDAMNGALVPVAFAFKPSHFTRGKDGAPSAVVPLLSADADKGDQETIVCAPVAFGGNNTSGSIDVATALNACGTSSGRMDFESETFVVQPDIAYAFKAGQSEAAGGVFVTEDYAPTLQAINNGSTAVPAVMYRMAVRRLTPLECERLQAFPDHYTRVLHKGKPAADSPRYKALGNSMCVNVMRWIGRSIEFAHNF